MKLLRGKRIGLPDRRHCDALLSDVCAAFYILDGRGVLIMLLDTTAIRIPFVGPTAFSIPLVFGDEPGLCDPS